MDEKLPLLFGRLPKAKYGFREIEPFRAEAAPDAYYYRPPEDGSRPAYFYVNTFRPEQRPKYTMEVLAYHEAVPGHHLQLAIQQELTDLPKFRRHGGYTAFIEGWGLYSEELPKLEHVELRPRAEKTLGPRFDIRKFHDELLGDGALALDVLENKMQSWIDRESGIHS